MHRGEYAFKTLTGGLTMTVRELVEKLSKFDPDCPVVCYSEDEALVPKSQLFRLLDIVWVDAADAEGCRLEDGTPYLKIGKSNVSREVVLLEVTLDF